MFKTQIRRINNLMAFASLGGQIKMKYGNSAMFLHLHGQIYHRASSLHPNDGLSPKYAQLYIVDSEIALRERMLQLTQTPPNQNPWNPTQDVIVILRQVNKKIFTY